MTVHRAGVGVRRRPVVVLLLTSAMLLLAAALGQASAQADVTAVKGSAFGYQCTVTVFGQNCNASTATPSVTLATDASNSPRTASAASGNASAGPATFFSSGQIMLSSQGSLGASGSVTSATSIQNVNASGNEPFTASSLASSCTASQTGVSATTTVTGGTLQTDNGDSDPTNMIADHPAVDVPVPANPAANTTIEGHVHIGNTTDTFRWVFNEQTVSADGSLTVTAAHEYLLGPTATGNVLVGQATCGITAGTPPPPPPPPPMSADLAIGISDSPDPVARDGAITYTVMVTNAGPDTATGVVVSTKVSGAKVASSSGATCSTLKGALRCDLGSIARDTSEQFTIVVTARRKPVTVSSTVSSTASDPNAANNSDSESTAIAP